MDIRITGTLDAKDNHTFPPSNRSLIIIQSPNVNYKNRLFLGITYKYLTDSNACIILLLNNRKYIEYVLVEKKMVSNELSAEGTYVLTNDMGWKYADINKLSESSEIEQSEINKHIDKRIQEFERSTILNDYPITQLDLTTRGLFSNNESKQNIDDTDDGFKDNSLLNEKGGPIIDLLFEPSPSDLYDKDESFKDLSGSNKNELIKKLKLVERISEDEMKIIVNKNIAIKNIILNEQDEINEGNKIIEWVTKHLMKTVFKDLKMAIHNGYVHIGRKGINVNDKVTEKLVPDLVYLKWQYGIPIDYDTLKFMLFQSDYQRKIKNHVLQSNEMEKILGLEYQIILQPKPKYVMFALKRLIMIWYSDEFLIKNIRKIKIIINQWRSNCDQSFNNKYGVMPMIVVYPRYGKDSARACLTKITDYFTLYNNIAWDASVPTYCMKVNDLIYYTNGNISLKMYYRTIANEFNGVVKNNFFDNKLNKIVGSEDLIY